MMEPDLHDGPMPLDCNVWIIRKAYRTVLVDTGFGPRAAAERRRPLDLDPIEAHISNEEQGKMEIKRSGSQPSGKAPPENFTGTIRVDPLFQTAAPSRVRGNCVTFEPGARTAWHTQPLGQTLIIVSGCGLVQSWKIRSRKFGQAISSGFHRGRSIGM